MAGFDGLQVAAFESRRAADMRQLIERQGGVAHVSPSMREVPLETNRAVIDFANRLITAQIDIVVLLTGVGTRHLVQAIERHVDRERFISALADTITIARGPKPVAAMKELGIAPTHRVPEPNTWRELLQTIDAEVPVAGQTVAVQEYGVPNPSLIAGLEARGATVEPVKVYDWELPEDTGPLEATARALAEGKIDVALFTSANQVTNLLRLADELDLVDAVRAGLSKSVVASIGPVTSARLREEELPVDLEPEHPKMGQLVVAAAERAGELRERKQRLTVEMLSSAPATRSQAPWHDSLFLRACRREVVERTPIWLMRQAGRYMREYREVREKTTFLELCKNPELCAEVAITARDRLDVDAAIIFSDLLPILEPMGFELEYAQGEGPIIHNPIRANEDVDRMVELSNVDALHYVMETCRLTREQLDPQIPLLGFAGAPFTLASYAIEGGGSRSFVFTKTLMYRDEGAWAALMERLVRGIARYLNAQVAAGVQAVQIFDSWVGCLSPADYRRYVMPYTRRLIESVARGVPVIHFATGNPALVPLLAEAGGDVVGVDWRMRLDDAWQAIGPDRGIMGNLDPLMLLADPADIRRAAGDILAQADNRPGHIFNLGHGVIPQTPVDSAIALVHAVRELSAR
ncbi:MAG: uroporphyrinogen decarboxylase [Planctomycetota bacterium]|nr:MAG: uroporphyrinogen decarboxylase [Planctomycetota bacterium]REJ92709.1 MAG: uroporphyrinogen decarboxylase [Planctomycetota bacterium]REK23747.1 MAG: uroporphyrinogen decarboxylase [Planctomycetota bacterium]REK47600.1 MAG: uroporphyrinogen decarboxylase [Planctomycetota bacterium]